VNFSNKLPDWDKMASMLRSISHPIRLMILNELASGAKCVRDVQEMFDISQPNLSQHLNALKNAGYVGYHSKGALRCYYLIRPTLVKKILMEFAKPHPVQVRPKAAVVQEVEEHQKKKVLPDR
jgi:ArsR family transcriptional regulator